jgi:hypothetical protein
VRFLQTDANPSIKSPEGFVELAVFARNLCVLAALLGTASQRHFIEGSGAAKVTLGLPFL